VSEMVWMESGRAQHRDRDEHLNPLFRGTTAQSFGFCLFFLSLPEEPLWLDGDLVGLAQNLGEPFRLNNWRRPFLI